jgi:segregation and condensation protein A
MQSALSGACTIKIENFEGPFDLLFHLLEKNKINIYDIPINEITEQYLNYLFAMRELDMEIASEFLVMASTLLHIKSRMLLPDRKEIREDEVDPREELVVKLIQYKRFKELSQVLKKREEEWNRVFYKLPEIIEIRGYEGCCLELTAEDLENVYRELMKKNINKINRDTGKMAQIVQYEKVSVKSKIKEIIRVLLRRTWFRFSEMFSPGEKSKSEIVSGFLAILELSKQKRVFLEQKKQFDDIVIRRTEWENTIKGAAGTDGD